MSPKKNSLQANFQDLEDNFPKEASATFHKASTQAKKQGLEVVQLINGELRRIKPDSSYVVIRKMEKPATAFRKGQTFELK
ncbi:MAG: hypothetical protein Q7Q71_15790 [Verrucomicrobiota bacterium JB023]|nr:hypothetical protein [Verrucomicrobiota bacterium JB023]